MRSLNGMKMPILAEPARFVLESEIREKGGAMTI